MTKRLTQRNTYKTGIMAEFLCRWWLQIKGYTILAQRYRTPAGEIDVVAQRGTVLSMIEVKARNSQREAMEALSPRQRQRIEKASLHFLARHPHLAKCTIRYDMMLVWRPWGIRHICNAWQALS